MCIVLFWFGFGLRFFFLFKQKTAYEVRISDWSSDVCSSDLLAGQMSRRIVVGERGDRRGAVVMGAKISVRHAMSHLRNMSPYSRRTGGGVLITMRSLKLSPALYRCPWKPAWKIR